MATFINQKFTFNEAKSIFKLLPNTVSMRVFFDSGTIEKNNKIDVVCNSINAVQAGLFLAAIDTECEVRILGVSDDYEFTLALNAAMNKAVEPQNIVYTKNQEIELWQEQERKQTLEDLENEADADFYFNK